jgi:Mg2+ and Co2+ transporter CorA
MSDFKVKAISIFSNLEMRFDQTDQHAPQALEAGKEAIEELKRDIQVNLVETKQELVSAKQELIAAHAMAALDKNADQSEIRRIQQSIQQLTNRLNSLENASAQIEALLSKYNQILGSFKHILKVCMPAKQELVLFENIAKKYLAMHGNSHNHGGRKSSSNEYNQKQDDIDVREVGDTFHYTRKDNLNQMDLDQLEGKLKEPGYKGSKISIDKISQNDFTLLEKNGYEISNIGPNEYSAYKEIEK